MKVNFFTIAISVMLLVWIVQAAKIALSQKQLTGKAILNFVASGCLVIGAIGFFGSALSATGGLNWLPESFEWPIGTASGILIKPDGTVIVPHTPSGRVQIYDKDLSFQRGWFVDAGGGTFKLSNSDGDNFYVFTARGNHQFLYDSHGSLLSHENYQSGAYSRVPSPGKRLAIPTPFYLLVFVHPFASWFVAVIGMLLLHVTGEARVRKGWRWSNKPGKSECSEGEEGCKNRSPWRDENS